MHSSAFPVLLLVILSLLHAVYSNHNANHCRKTSHCRSDVSHQESRLYGLEMTVHEHSRLYPNSKKRSDVLLTVYAKNFPNLDTVGPSWYRLEAISPTTDTDGNFLRPLYRSDIVIKDQVIDFIGTNKPRTILDLPRTYKWLSEERLTGIVCFKLTIQHGDACEQIVTPNCTDLISQNTTNVSTTATPTTATPTTEPRITSTSSGSPDCYTIHNCTKRKKNPTCGSDGAIYPHVCYLRLRQCLFDKNLQRDRTGISCAATSTPTVATTPSIPPDQTCLRYGHDEAKCNCQGKYKVIQCASKHNTIECWCSFSRVQIQFGSRWIVNEESYSQNKGIIRCKNIA